MKSEKKISFTKDKNQLVLPDDIVLGCSYFMEVMPGLVAIIVDSNLQMEAKERKVIDIEDYYIACYDLNNEINIHPGKNKKVNYKSTLGLIVVDATLKNSCTPFQKAYSFWLLISKSLFQKYVTETSHDSANRNEANNTIFFSSHIDSRTRLCILKLTRKYNNPSFELTFRGTSLQVFAYLVERINENGIVSGKLSESDTTQIIKTQTYLMEQLLGGFPGIDFLAEMTGMSVSKYKKLFKRMFKESPNGFFLREKLNLAQELLKSGNFKAINEVAYELGYVKPGYFASKYKKQFGQLPGEVFIKNKA